MNIEEFITNFAEQFEDTDESVFQSNTQFKNLDEWCSMLALTIIAMCDAEYNAKIKGDDIKNSDTIEDLFKIVVSRV